MNIANIPPADLGGLYVRLDAYQRTADALQKAGRPMPKHLAELIEDLKAEIINRERAWEDQNGAEADNREQASALKANGKTDDLRWLLILLFGVLVVTGAFLHFR